MMISLSAAAPPNVASANPSPEADRAAERYGFGGADLGMTLEGWRKLSPRAPPGSCWSPEAAGKIVTCATDDLPLGASYAARELRYKFVDGKLVQISFQTSVDGFDYVTAALKRRFGEPTDIERDTIKLQDGVRFPHVQMTWRNGRSTISLSDPAASGVVLSVQITLDAASQAVKGDAAADVGSRPKLSPGPGA